MTRKCNLVIAVLFLWASVAHAQTATAPAAGSGTSASPYQIATADNLYWLSQNSSEWVSGKYFIQTADINLSASSGWDGGKGFSPIGNSTNVFYGNYNGQGYTISGLYINRPASSELGLFGRLASGTIQNLNVTGATVQTSSPPSFTYMGIIVGQSSGIINNCHVSGTVSGGNHYEGGIAGYAGGQINNCSSGANVQGANYVGGIAGFISGTVRRVFSSGTITCNNLNGGITGMLQYGTLENAYSSCTISGSFRAGGVVGYISTSGTARNVYAYGDVSGSSRTGGCFGDVHATAVIQNCFWDTQTTGLDTSAGAAIGKTTAEMKSMSTFINAGWDFMCETTNGSNEVWGIRSSVNNGYPFLAWQGGYSSNCNVWTGSANSEWASSSNWMNNVVPGSGEMIYIAEDASADLVLEQNLSLASIDFLGADRKVVLENYDLSVGAIRGADADNFIQTNGSGRLLATLANNTSFTFPIGNTVYNPVSITNNTGASDVFSVGVSNQVLSEGTSGDPVSGEAYIQRTWDISKTSANGGAGVSFTFYWNNGEETAPVATPTLFHYDGGWAKQTGTTSSSSNSLTYSGYTGTFSPFAVMDATASLPVSWIAFSAAKKGASVLLNWSTASETNSADFVVQHRHGNEDWKNIGTIPAAMNSNNVRGYRYEHAQPAEGTNYYRLLQRDMDGKSSYSDVATVLVENAAARLSLYPNPVTNGKAMLHLPSAATVQVINLAGVTVFQKQYPAGNHSVSLGGLAKGTYYLKAGKETISFIVQ